MYLGQFLRFLKLVLIIVQVQNYSVLDRTYGWSIEVVPGHLGYDIHMSRLVVV